MFYKKTLEFIQENIAISLAKKNEQITALQKRCEQLEKRINNIADYIQGPYTNQINENFTQINLQIQAILDKKLKQKIKKHTKEKTIIKASKPKRIK